MDFCCSSNGDDNQVKVTSNVADESASESALTDDDLDQSGSESHQSATEEGAKSKSVSDTSCQDTSSSEDSEDDSGGAMAISQVPVETDSGQPMAVQSAFDKLLITGNGSTSKESTSKEPTPNSNPSPAASDSVQEDMDHSQLLLQQPEQSACDQLLSTSKESTSKEPTPESNPSGQEAMDVASSSQPELLVSTELALGGTLLQSAEVNLSQQGADSTVDGGNVSMPTSPRVFEESPAPDDDDDDQERVPRMGVFLTEEDWRQRQKLQGLVQQKRKRTMTESSWSESDNSASSGEDEEVGKVKATAKATTKATAKDPTAKDPAKDTSRRAPTRTSKRASAKVAKKDVCRTSSKKINKQVFVFYCPMTTCEVTTNRADNMRRHLTSRAETGHSLQPDDAMVTDVKGPRREYCRYCQKLLSNRSEHEKKFCKRRPGLKATSQPSAMAELVTDGEGDATAAGGASADVGGRNILAEFKVWVAEYHPAGTARPYATSVKSILAYFEQEIANFDSNQLLAFSAPNPALLPCLKKYIGPEREYNIHTAHRDQAAYSQLVNFLKAQLDDVQAVQGLTTGSYTLINSHLESRGRTATQTGRKLNKQIQLLAEEKRAKEKLEGYWKTKPTMLRALVQEYLQCKFIKELAATLRADMSYELAKNSVTEYYVGNFLMAEILLNCGGLRGDAIRNMTLQEFRHPREEHGQVRKSRIVTVDVMQYVVSVKVHKTKRQGAAEIPLSESLYEMMDDYSERARPALVDRYPQAPKFKDLGKLDAGGKQQYQCLESGCQVVVTNRSDHTRVKCGGVPFFLQSNGKPVRRMDEVMAFIKKTLVLHCGKTQEELKDLTSSDVRACWSSWSLTHKEGSIRQHGHTNMNHSEGVHKGAAYYHGRTSLKADFVSQWQYDNDTAGASRNDDDDGDDEGDDDNYQDNSEDEDQEDHQPSTSRSDASTSQR
jgi:hypothetical protein